LYIPEKKISRVLSFFAGNGLDAYPDDMISLGKVLKAASSEVIAFTPACCPNKPAAVPKNQKKKTRILVCFKNLMFVIVILINGENSFK
jgi:hypothetical protein